MDEAKEEKEEPLLEQKSLFMSFFEDVKAVAKDMLANKGSGSELN